MLHGDDDDDDDDDSSCETGCFLVHITSVTVHHLLVIEREQSSFVTLATKKKVKLSL
jgi:hypothetical protein